MKTLSLAADLAAAAAPAQTVVDLAAGSPVHTTLVAAVTAAGLAETLSGAGPFTVFAPPTTLSRPCPRASSRACSSRRTSMCSAAS
jgi:hypothetical protein